MTTLPELGDWRRTSPFAIVFFFASTIRAIVGNTVNLVTSFGLVAFLARFDFLSSGSSRALVVLLVLAGIGLLALGRYWFFRFRLEEDRILIRQGFLNRTALDLPFDRVQAINVERSLVDRLLGLVSVRIDTSGSSTAEGRLPTISGELADWLRERVERGRRTQPAETETIPAPPIPTDTPAPTPRTLLRLTGGDLVRIGLADYRILLVLGALGGVTGDAWWNRIADNVQSAWVGYSLQTLVVAAIGIALLLALFFTAATLGGAFLRYHDFTLSRKGTALHTRGGLLTQKEVVVEIDRVQHLALAQGLVMRAFRRFQLSALTAAGGAESVTDRNARSQLGLADNLHVPLLDGPMGESLRREVFGDEAKDLSLLPADPRFIRVSPWYIRAAALRIALVPLWFAAFVLAFGTVLETVFVFVGTEFAGRTPPSDLLVAPALIGLGQPVLPWFVAWLLASVLIAWQLWRRRAVLRVDEGLAARRGLLGYRVDAFLFRKAQSVKVKQSPLQRRKRLATLTVHLASDKITVPYIDHGTACRLRDYILWTVESNRRRWY